MNQILKKYAKSSLTQQTSTHKQVEMEPIEEWVSRQLEKRDCQPLHFWKKAGMRGIRRQLLEALLAEIKQNKQFGVHHLGRKEDSLLGVRIQGR